MPQQMETIMCEIQQNADYGGRPEGLLENDEVVSMHQQVLAQMQSTNGDAGECVISTRQLAILLNAYRVAIS